MQPAVDSHKFRSCWAWALGRKVADRHALSAGSDGAALCAGKRVGRHSRARRLEPGGAQAEPEVARSKQATTGGKRSAQAGARLERADLAGGHRKGGELFAERCSTVEAGPGPDERREQRDPWRVVRDLTSL